MENTIRVKDHPLVALGNRNIQSQDEYYFLNSDYVQEYYWDIEKDYRADGLLCPDSVDLMIANESFCDDDDDDDLPF